jgi:hypothetical protein
MNKAPHGTQQWLNETRGIDKLPGETDEQFNIRVNKAAAAAADATATIVRNPETGATFMVMPGLPGDTLPSGRRKRI